MQVRTSGERIVESLNRISIPIPIPGSSVRDSARGQSKRDGSIGIMVVEGGRKGQELEEKGWEGVLLDGVEGDAGVGD